MVQGRPIGEGGKEACPITGPDTPMPSGPPPPPGPAHNGLLWVIVWLGAAIVILLIVLIVVLVAEDDGSDAAADVTATETVAATSATTLEVTTTEELPASSSIPATTTVPATTTATSSSTTTSGATTTTTLGTTTTAAPFVGSLGKKSCPATFPDAELVGDIQFSSQANFTRIVFIFDGEPPGCEVGYIDAPDELRVTVFAVPVLTDPWAPGVFDPAGYLAVGLGSVIGVDSGGQGGGSGEWSFVIEVDGTKAFTIDALPSPSRLVIDIED